MVRIDNNNLHLLLEDAKDTGLVSNELGQLFLDLADNILGKSRYRGYPEDTKYEMQLNAMIPMCKYCFRYDAEKASGKTPAFSYCTRIIEMSFWDTLNKYYKAKNSEKDEEPEEAYSWWEGCNQVNEYDAELTEIYEKCCEIVARMSLKDRQIASILWGFGIVEDVDDDEAVDANDIRKNRQRIWRAIKKELMALKKV